MRARRTTQQQRERKLFTQSRVLLNLQWRDFVDERNSKRSMGEPRLIATNADGNVSSSNAGDEFDKTTGLTVLLSNESSSSLPFDEDATLNLNRVHFQTRLFDAASRNPISTIYSLIWTLCYTIQANTSESENVGTTAEYGSVWYPMFLLQKYMARIKQILMTSRDKNAPAEEAVGLTELEQILAADVAYERLLRENYPGYADESERETVLATRKKNVSAYLTSAVFRRQCERTPFGTVETAPPTDNDNNSSSKSYQLLYVDRLLDVADPRCLIFEFERTLAYEFVREQAESSLRRMFPRYHEAVGIEFESYLMSSTCLDVVTWGDKVDKEKLRYAMYWQYQKSTILWFVMHTLFALNELAGNEETTEDLLFFVAHHMERFLQCKICQNHWKSELDGGQRDWLAHEDEFMRWRKIRESSVTPFMQILDRVDRTREYDLLLLETHNSIQGRRVNMNKFLTRAALEAIRVDYANFAQTLASCVAVEIGKQSLHVVPEEDEVGTVKRSYNNRVYDLESSRTDVLHDRNQLILSQMLHEQTLNAGASKLTSPSGATSNCWLLLQRKKINGVATTTTTTTT